MASLFPWMQEEEKRPAASPAPLTQPPTDLASRARREAQQELEDLRGEPEPKPREKPTLLEGFRGFRGEGF